MIWFLMALLAAIGIGIFVWDFRRKTAAREAASKKRFDEIFMARTAAAPVPAAPHAEVPVPAVSRVEVKPAAPIAAPAAGRFLGQTETLVYRLLKAGIPDHEVFANTALSSVVGGKNEQETRRLAQFRLDFVVCDKSMQVVAVVELEAPGNPQATAEQHFRAVTLKTAGIPLVRFNPAALPRREDVRALVCGQSAPARGG